MVQFLSINFFLGFLQFLLGFSKVPIFLCHPIFTVKGYRGLYTEKAREYTVWANVCDF